MDPTISVLAALLAGGAGGFVMSLLGWLESGEPFNARKSVAGILASSITGILTTTAMAQTSIFTDPATPAWQIAIAIVTIFGASAGFGSMGRKAVGAANILPSATKSEETPK